MESARDLLKGDLASRDHGTVPPAGTVIDGRYRVGSLLGSGGMGVVLEVTHAILGHALAIKFLRSELASEPGAARRFVREARAAAGIKSEHVCRVIDVGELPGGLPYIVMERLEGRDLALVLEQEKTIAVTSAVDYVLQVIEAVAEAHALGIVHRDLKPRNLFLTRRSDGSVCIKVLDFGIAKAMAPDGATTVGKTDRALGSPHYMSPEQVRAPDEVDFRTDVWSLGVVLYQLSSGVVPFDGPGLPAIGAAIVGDPHTALTQRAPEVAQEFSLVVDRCLAKRREDRFGSLHELAAALAPFASAEGAKSIQRIEKLRQEPLPAAHTTAEPSDQVTLDLTADPKEMSGERTLLAEAEPTLSVVDQDGATKKVDSSAAVATKRFWIVALIVVGLGVLFTALFKPKATDTRPAALSAPAALPAPPPKTPPATSPVAVVAEPPPAAASSAAPPIREVQPVKPARKRPPSAQSAEGTRERSPYEDRK